MADVKEPKPSSFRLLVLVPSTEIPHPPEDSSTTSQPPRSDTRSIFSPFLTCLTDSAPAEELTTFAGYTTHSPLRIRNKYYSADVTLWCDELPHPISSTHEQDELDLGQWTQQMLSAEAKEAREVIGGIVIVLPYAHAADTTVIIQKREAEEQLKYLKAVNELRDLIEDESGRDVATLVVVMDMTPKAAAMRIMEQKGGTGVTSFTEMFEEMCVSDYGIFGWDVVPWQPEFELSSKSNTKAETSDGLQHERAERLRNEYGEQIGMARILEILEQTNWSASINDAEAEEGYGLLSTDDLAGPDDDDFYAPGLRARINMRPNSNRDVVAQQSDEFQREIMGLHFALEEQIHQQTEDDRDSGDDLQVEQLTGLMDRIIATREAAAEMSKEDREKFARREVSKIMREMK